jgi:hypothetical protein
MLVILLVIALMAIWVGYDARKFDWSGSGLAKTPFEWAVGCLLLGIILFPVYLVRRRQVPRREGLVLLGAPEQPAWAPPAFARVPCPACGTPVHPSAQICNICGRRL